MIKSRPRYLIVGGAGYFGARLSEALSLDADIVLTQRTQAPERQTWIEKHGFEVVNYDSALSQGLSVTGEFDAVIHLASPGAAEASRDPEAARQRALNVADHCLDLLNEGRAARLLHFSTFHVYGAAGSAHYSESDPMAPIHAYGRIHAECEGVVRAHPSALVVRPSNMIGTPAHAALGDQAKLMFLDLCRQAAEGAMKLHNDGKSFRDFLPFPDGIAAVQELLKAPLSGERVFNLARGKAVRIDAVAQMIQQAAGAATLEFGTGTDAFRAPFEIDTSRLRALGWTPQTLLEEETVRIIQFYR